MPMSTHLRQGNQRAFVRRAFLSLGAACLLIALLAPSVLTSSGVSAASSDSTVRVLAAGDMPIADAGDNMTISPNQVVTFDASGSVPSDGAVIENYTWLIVYQVSDKSTWYDENFTWSAYKSGLYTVTLTIRDSNNRTDSDKILVLVSKPAKGFLETNAIILLIVGGICAVAGYYVLIAVKNLRMGQPVISEAAREKLRLAFKRLNKLTSQLLRNPMGLVGVVVLAFFVLMAMFGPMIAPYQVDLSATDPENNFLPQSQQHWFGTDNFGLDIFSELLNGARTSMIVGIFSAVIASFLGAAVGLYSGYVGGWKDEVIMRMNDIVLSIPWLVLMIIVAAFIGSIDLTGIILIIGLTGWSTTARMVRAQVLSVKERQYIERARSFGSSDVNIIRRHVFPNTFPLIFANTILTVAVSILSEATLSFLGLRPAGVVTWGTMLSFAADYDAFAIGLHWWILAPGFCIVAVVLGFTLLGYALDELLNPKLRRR